MNVLFLSTWYPYPPDNGSKLRIYYLLKALGARHDVTLLSMAFGTARAEEGGRELRKFCSDVRTIALSPFERERSARVLSFLSPSPIVNREVPAMRSLVLQALAQKAYGVVIASTNGMAEYTKFVPPGSVRVLEEHNSLSRQMWDRYQNQTHPVRRLRCWASWQKTRRYEAAVLRRHDLAVMVSEEDRHACLTMLPGYAGPVKVLPNGVDCQQNRPGLVATAAQHTDFQRRPHLQRQLRRNAIPPCGDLSPHQTRCANSQTDNHRLVATGGSSRSGAR